MCGIFGYIGKENAAHHLRKGLVKLSYRGYDSWGFGLKEGNDIKLIKEVGDIENADVKLESNAKIGIGHTRWATHGEVTERNCHPHLCSSGVAVIHNGIVENADELKKELEGRHKFHSETDTEVIAHLIGDELNAGTDFPEAVRKTFLKLKGRNAIVAMHKYFDGIVGIKSGSPLVVGIKGDEYFIGSDIQAFAEETDKAIYLDDHEMVVLGSEHEN
ncbi:MAG: class II glutamine amidotransferase [Candidatus Aenigmarchaeota archaeon]|nr:class II glutamine amidotransferase [Candidatus Aenigmarchaeota archaeon]